MISARSISPLRGERARGPQPLVIDNVSLRFAGLEVLREVSFAVEPGDLLALIGPNGAGKSSLLNCVSGVYVPDSGEIRYGRHTLTGLRPHRIAELGVARVFQNVELFDRLSVRQNVLLGRHLMMRTGMLAGMLWFGRASREERAHAREVDRVLDYCGLLDRADEPVRELPYGIKKRVEYARALAMEPGLLLLDEPVAGMNDQESAEMAALIRQLHTDLGLSVVVVEHDMRFVMGLAQKIAVLDFGKLIAYGDPATVRTDPAVLRAYLGGSGE